jgi:phage minor structural protein
VARDYEISLKSDRYTTKTLATINASDVKSIYSLYEDVVDGLHFVQATVEKLAESQRKQRTYTGYITREEFNSLNVSTVPIPQNFAGLEAVDVPTRLQEQLFRIYEVEESEDYVTVHARHVWYDNLQNYTTWEPTEETQYTGAAVCRNILSNAVSPVDSNVASDCTDTKPGSEFDYARKNIVECFLDPENGVCAKFGLSLIRYNWDFFCLKNVGFDRGYVIQDKKNLLGVVRTESIENLATRIVPIGMDKQGEIVWLNNNGLRYVDSQYINDYSKPRVEIYDTGLRIGQDDVTAENINEKLLQAAQRRFTEDKVDLPEITMTINFLSIGDTEEYVQYRGLDKVYLFDIVTIKDTTRGYEYSAQVVGVEHDILTGMLTSITLGTINNSDGVRKIASWQVPEVSGENIRLKTIMAGAFQPGAINYDDIATGAVGWIHINAASISQLTTEQLEALTANIHELIAGSITADDIQANSITTAKLAADAVTADKIAANAVTAQKLAAGSVTAAKIDANDVSAINATLGTAAIADARIAVADIDYAKVKDLAADTAIFSTTITDQGVADRLYINRLLITYGQMVEATIGDLVIGATDGNYYHVDVVWENDTPSLVPTRVQTPTAAEIEAGHTTGGKTIIGNVGTFAELSSEDFYAINGIIDRITAKRIDVDELWAREAFVGKLMVTDITANPTIGVIKSQIGDWTGGSTITQTINSLSSRITQLGYGAIYYSETEPSHENLNVGDIWIEPVSGNTWDDIAEYTWDELASMTWDQVAGQYRMRVWSGTEWKLLFDNLIVDKLTTEIQQTAYAVTLKADKTLVDHLSGDVQEFSATLEVQAEQIQSAVSSVNNKSANYTRATDPSTDSSITLHPGDTWTKAIGDGTWESLANYTWDELAQFTWDELAGASVYTWNGSKWIKSSDWGATIQSRTLITQTANDVAILAEKTDEIDGELVTTKANLTVANDRITQEVSRATAAENNRIEKTTQYQTADSIVTEAVKQSGTNASRSYIAKTSTYQTADSIVTEAVTQAGSAASSAYIAKTNTYQTAESIVAQAQSYTNGKLSDYSTTTQTSTMISNYVTNNAYKLVSGITITASGVDISGSQHVNIASGGTFKVTTGNFLIDTSVANTGYVMLSGSATASSATFKLKKDGSLTVTKLLILDKNGNESEINLRAAGLWKLNGASTVVSYGLTDGYCTRITLSSGEQIPFRSAASVVLSGNWSGNKFEVTNTGNDQKVSAFVEFDKAASQIKDALSGETHKVTLKVNDTDRQATALSVEIDATGAYDSGWDDAVDAVIGDKTSAEVNAALLANDNHATTLTILADDTIIDTWNIDASAVYTLGYTAASPYGAVAIGARVAGTTYAATVTKRDGTTVLTMATCSTPYNDGVAAGEAKFSVHSGSLYTVDSHGVPTRYTGTLYDKIG